MKNIAIFASGNGTNAENLIRFFAMKPRGARVAVVVCNRADAGVLDRCRRLGVASEVLPREAFGECNGGLAEVLDRYAVDCIVLAGFLLRVPEWLIRRYPDAIVNIHPALLPRFGGKGMYGHHVHEAVVAAGATETGITVHLVNERYDDGRILFQARVAVTPDDTPADVEAKVHVLEMRHFPAVVARAFGLDAD